MNRIQQIVLLLAVAAVTVGCAVRLGGEKPVGLFTVGVYAEDGTPTATVASRLTETAAQVALVAARTDTAWFREVADAAGLELSGPGRAGDLFMGFLAMEALGDTTITLEYPGGEFVLHDALYQVGEERLLDLMAFPIASGGEARALVRSLLRYVATDVGATAAVVIAVAAETEAAGDSVATMLSPAFSDVRRCMGEEDRAAARTAGPHMRLFYGPEARLACEVARPLDGGRGAAVAELVVLR